MLIEKFVLTPFQQNTRVVACEATRKAICIDPGERSDDLVAFIRDNDLDLLAIGLTHGHLDHVGGTRDLSNAFPDAEILLHEDDQDLYYWLRQQPLLLGIPPDQMAALGLNYDDPPKLTRNWIDGEIFEVGTLSFSVRHCPGHTRGHVVLVEEKEKAVFAGDCLFSGTIGRTDLPGGSHEQLIGSIIDKVMTLDDDHVVYPGHGPETTVGAEREHNPFLNNTYRLSGGRYV